MCVLAGCDPASRFAVVEAEEPAMNGLASLHGRVVVESSARRDVMIESAWLVVRYKGRELAAARLMLPIAVPARRSSSVRWDLALEGLTIADLRTLENGMRSNPMQLTFDVKAYVRYGALRKKVEMRDVPVTRIITNFGAPVRTRQRI